MYIFGLENLNANGIFLICLQMPALKQTKLEFQARHFPIDTPNRAKAKSALAFLANRLAKSQSLSS